MSGEALRSVIRSYRTVGPKSGVASTRKTTIVVRTVIFCSIGAFPVHAFAQASMSERKHSAPYSQIIR